MTTGRTLAHLMYDHFLRRHNDVGEGGYGETHTESIFPYVDGNAVYGFIPSNFREFTATSGSTGVEDRLFKCSTGETLYGYGAIQSFRAINYKSGFSGVFSGSAYFGSGVADSVQGFGLLSLGDELSFGYDGTAFGVWHRWGGLPEVRTITVTGASGGSTDLTLTLNGVAYTIPLTAGSVEHNAYEIEAWLNANQSVWVADQLDDTVVIAAQSDGAKAGAYTFSHATATGSIAQDTAGVTKSSEHIAQADWNEDAASWLDPTKGNIYRIIYQNMGFGNALFYVMDDKQSRFVRVHTLRNINKSTTPLIGNPSLRCGMYVASLGSTTDISMYSESMAGGLIGTPRKTRNPRAVSATQSITTTDETTVLTLRNNRTYNSYLNQVEIDPLEVSVSNETTRNAVVRVRAVTDFGAEQNFTAVGTNLISAIDTTASVFSGGRLLATRALPPSGQVDINLKELELRQPPTLKLIVTVERAATGGSNTNFTGTYTYYEDV